MTLLWKISFNTLDFPVVFVIHAIVHRRRGCSEVTQGTAPAITILAELRAESFGNRISNQNEPGKVNLFAGTALHEKF